MNRPNDAGCLLGRPEGAALDRYRSLERLSEHERDNQYANRAKQDPEGALHGWGAVKPNN